MALSRKFKSLAHYDEALKSGYQLLPFNFHRLAKDRYLIANMVGEHLSVDRALLVELAEGTVTPMHPAYNDLKAKHFIMDQDSTVAIDLLALKYRTKQHTVAQFTALHIFVVTLRCDYSCKYCQVSRRMEGDDTFDMSEATAERALELAFMSPSKVLKIEFQGGEPLLNFTLIKFIVNRALEINISARKSLQFVITTNLTFVGDEVLQFCDKHSIYFSTSLDGPASLHNKNRPRPNRDGYERTIAGIRAVQAYLGKDAVSALMTTTEESLSQPREIIDEYVSHGFNTIFLRPLSPYGFAVKTKQTEKYNSAHWMNFYREGLAHILELNRAGYFLVEQYTAIILQKILTPSNSGYVDLQSPAGIGICAVVYNYDGDVYASDEARMLKEMGDTTFRLGSVHDNSYEEIFSSDVLLNTLEESLAESAPMCSECGLISYCGTDPVYHYATQGDVVGKKPLSFFCRKNTAVIEHIFHLLDDAESRRILESWVQ